MRRKITLAFLILAAFLLQTTVFQYFQIASVTPNLLPVSYTHLTLPTN